MFFYIKMILTRRNLLLNGLGFASGCRIVGKQKQLSHISPNPNSKERLFLYSLGDYANSEIYLQQAERIFLDSLKGVTLIHTWATWCDPCIEDLPEYRKLFADYPQKARFISAFLESSVTMKDLERILPADPNDFFNKCVGREISQFNDPLYKELRESVLSAPPYHPKLVQIIDGCTQETDTFYKPLLEKEATEKESREQFREECLKLMDKGQWLPGWIQGVLTDRTTQAFLFPRDDIGVPFTTFLVDGRCHKTIYERDIGAVKSELDYLMKETKTIP